ncbi:hypothetical protein KP509_09G088900 [Ceratopteris richardii]|uniref:BHLH domain-containing protein n=1 Tax=Ceratopteris richardii TaxID=49495 RepID=A0A8T2U364_CERRI|nr:hypothetical protein KP509_09G088900 [Ceratopteris richardii]
MSLSDFGAKTEEWLEEEAAKEGVVTVEQQLVEDETCSGSSCSKKRMRHIDNERKRRILMNNLLDSLQSLLPDSYPRKDRCALLSDVIEHVQLLEDQARRLEAQTAQMTREKVALRHSASRTKVCPTDELTGQSKGPPCPELVRNFHVQFMPPLHNGHPRAAEGSHNSTNGSDGGGGDRKELVLTFASPSRSGLLPHVLELLQRSELIVMDCSLSTIGDDEILWYIHAQVPTGRKLTSDQVKSLFS